MELGYTLSSEEHRPLDLVRQATLAEQAGFAFALVEGPHYRVDNARLYTLPEEPIEVIVAAGGAATAELAARIGDGLVGTAPESELVDAYARAGGDGARYGQLTVCWARSEDEARRTAFEQWPNAVLQGPLAQELPLPSHFEAAAGMVSEDDVARSVVCGPDPDRHLEGIRAFADAGFDHVYVHQVGPDQEGFFSFYEREVLPEVVPLEPERAKQRVGA